MGHGNIYKHLLVFCTLFTYYIGMKQTIPDLRSETEVTIEHISKLREQLGQVLEDAYPGEGISDIVTNYVSDQVMREQILSIFTPQAFLTMFQTETGKGILIGAFYQAYIDSEEV